MRQNFSMGASSDAIPFSLKLSIPFYQCLSVHLSFTFLIWWHQMAIVTLWKSYIHQLTVLNSNLCAPLDLATTVELNILYNHFQTKSLFDGPSWRRELTSSVKGEHSLNACAGKHQFVDDMLFVLIFRKFQFYSHNHFYFYFWKRRDSNPGLTKSQCP